MKECSHCKSQPKVLVLKQSENEEEYICVQCLISTYGDQLGWMGKQVVSSMAKQLEGLTK